MAAKSVVHGQIWPNFELIQILIRMISLLKDSEYVIVTCKYEKDQMKNSRDNVMASFSPF